MASDSRADDAATRSLRRTVETFLSELSQAIFGVCAVAVGLITLFVGAGSTGESAAVFLTVGIASLLVGVVTISRLPKPEKTAAESDSTVEQSSSTARAADSDEEPDRHRQQAD